MTALHLMRDRRVVQHVTPTASFRYDVRLIHPDAGRVAKFLCRVFLLVVAIVVLLFLGRGILAGWARQIAVGQMNAGAMTRAQQWLAWSRWLHAGDGTTELMQAACYRHLKQEERWVEAVQSAKRKGAPPQQIQQEIDLGLVRTGTMRHGAESQLRAMIDAGALAARSGHRFRIRLPPPGGAGDGQGLAHRPRQRVSG